MVGVAAIPDEKVEAETQTDDDGDHDQDNEDIEHQTLDTQ